MAVTAAGMRGPWDLALSQRAVVERTPGVAAFGPIYVVWGSTYLAIA